MAETMKTAVFTGIKEIELQECERPVPKEISISKN